MSHIWFWEMSDIQFIKIGDNYENFWIFDIEIGRSHTLEKVWYDLKHRGKKIDATKLIYMDAQSFTVSESSSTPIWKEAINYGEHIGADFIFRVGQREIKEYSSEMCVPRIKYVIGASYFRKKGTPDKRKDEEIAESVKNRFELLDFRK